MVRVDAEVIENLRDTCQENGFVMGYVVKRLVERFLVGDFSGSFLDVIREDATPEWEAPGKCVEEALGLDGRRVAYFE